MTDRPVFYSNLTCKVVHKPIKQNGPSPSYPKLHRLKTEMAHALRPLILQCMPRWHRHRVTALCHLYISQFPPPRANITPSYHFVHFQLYARRLDQVSVTDEDEGVVKKSRNEKKREAQRAVRWGMELANFSPSQIKRIIRVADLEQEVYDAIMLVKGLGRDVREGKRRQFSYIGRLLRDVEPEIMEGLIQATKDGDQTIFQNIPVTEKSDSPDEEEEEEEEEEEIELEVDENSVNTDVATRWYDGLINKDASITNEIYSLQDVEFDRQELRRLVRKVHSTTSEDNGKDAVNARRSLTRFLRDLVKQLPPQ